MFKFSKLDHKIIKKNKNWIILYLILAFVLFSVFFLEFKIVGQSVYGDSRYYMAFTRSIYFSQNIDITDEMAHYWSPETNNIPAAFNPVPDLQRVIKVTTSNFSLGISIVWLPIYFLADILVIIISKFNPDIIRNGYSDIYQIVLGLGNISFVLGGLIILSNLLSKFYEKKVVMLSILSLLFTTNLFYYSAIDVVNTHPFSFFGTSILLYLYFKYKENKKNTYLFIQGIVFGLLVANRMQDGLLILIPLLTIFNQTKIKKIKINKEIIKIIVFGIGGMLGYLPQLILLFLGLGRIQFIPHLEKAGNDFMPFRHVIDIMIDPKLGVLLYMPSLVISVIGLFIFRNRNKKLGVLFLVSLFSVFVLISSYDGWNVAGYSARYFISIFPILIFGFAEIINLFYIKKSKVFLYMIILILILHQGISIFSFKLFLQDPTYVGSELSKSGKLKIKIIESVSQHFSY